MEGLATKFDNLDKIVKHQSDNYNLKTRVDNLEKLVRHQSNSADSILVKTLESGKQNLMQEMDKLKTDISDITDKIDNITASNVIRNSIITSLKTKVEQDMDKLKTDITDKVDKVTTNNAILNTNATTLDKNIKTLADYVKKFHG